MGELFDVLVREHMEKREAKMENAKEILFGKKTLTNKDAENILLEWNSKYTIIFIFFYSVYV